jgi:hypothetical protein
LRKDKDLKIGIGARRGCIELIKDHVRTGRWPGHGESHVIDNNNTYLIAFISSRINDKKSRDKVSDRISFKSLL